MALPPVLSDYNVLIEYIGADLQSGLRPTQRFEGSLAVNLDTAAITLTIPLPSEQLIFSYDGLTECEKEWKIIERKPMKSSKST